MFEIIFYILTFLVLFTQIYFFVVFLENYKSLNIRKGNIKLFEREEDYPSVSITVPAYNEGKNNGESIRRSLESLFNLNYPKNKLKIILVDDGSTDNTFKVMQEYENHPQVFKVFQKENGGKYTAQNLGLEYSFTDFVGCLDSDSAVHPEALNRIMTYFKDDKVMSVASTIIPQKPKNIIEKAQQIDYELQIYVKKMFGFVNAIHVTPGPFSIFRKSVFEKIGPYRHAHNTEDQEIALRMHENKMKIEHAPDAYVYTNTPKTAKSLYKQRTRWLYGFINNALDYKHFFVSKKYGNIGFITLPTGFISIFGTIFLLFFSLFNIGKFFYKQYIIYSVSGLEAFDFNFKNIDFSFFYFNTSVTLFLSFFIFLSLLFSLYRGYKMLNKKESVSIINIFYFYIVYAILAPLWLLKAVWNTLIRKESSWTQEINVRK